MIIKSILAKQYPIRDIQMNPEYYLGNDLDIQENGTIKRSSKNYIKEVLKKSKGLSSWQAKTVGNIK